MEYTTLRQSAGSAPSDLGEATKDHRVRALLEIEDLVAGGKKVRDAVAEVAKKTGIGERTPFRYRGKTNFVPRAEWGAVLAPKWNPAHGMKAMCHPDALSKFISLCRSGIGISESYRRMAVEAKSKLWTPIASERTLRRELDRQVTRTELRKSRRDAQPGVEV